MRFRRLLLTAPLLPLAAACATTGGSDEACDPVCTFLCLFAPDREAPPPPPPPPPPPRAEPDPCAGRIVLRGVNFEFDSDQLTASSSVTLDVVAETLAGCPRVRTRVEGHTDSVGGDAYNQGLSERRAESVRRYLVGRGISAGRIESRGYGESRPVADNGTDEGRALNRRVELTPIQ
jgi:OOP family OmpA-OmpF porin